MFQVDYICQRCGWEASEDYQRMVCKCGGDILGVGVAGIAGTRDSFGIKKEFQDERTGKTIDNWRSWEKAGFRNPLDVVKNSNIKAGIKRKIDKIKHDKSR